MKRNKPDADFFVPDKKEEQEALARTTHLGVGAHQDDLEFMALHGILQCYRKSDLWFGGVVCTDGVGSVRTGAYANFSDDAMKQQRMEEQRTAALIGQYSFMSQLGHSSRTLQSTSGRACLVEDLVGLLALSAPEVVYTHNPADKHMTHLGVFCVVLDALRQLSEAERPREFLGCEVWRGLDWLDDREKVIMDVSAHPDLSASLRRVFDSQISGGKRYDMAVEGRARANATFLESRQVDEAEQVAYAIDLMPLLLDPNLSPVDFISAHIRNFGDSVRESLGQFGGQGGG